MKDTSIQAETRAPFRPGAGSQRFAAVGGVIGALAASSCCMLPLLLFSIGVSGAWIGNLTQLAPYQPYFIVFALANVAFGSWRVYKARTVMCEPGSACEHPIHQKAVIAGLVTATLLVAAALSFNIVTPLVLGT